MTARRQVLVFMGTRPEAIKLAPVVAGLRASRDFSCTVVATGQHRELFQQAVGPLGLQVDADLGAMRPGQSLAALTARLVEGIDRWLEAARPDLALVQGDTTTVLMAALACFYRRVPVGHVEAGLRTGDLRSPFPEEVNRRLAAPLVALHFAPTPAAREALLREGVEDGAITVTGNTVIDQLQREVALQSGDAAVRAGVEAEVAALLGPGGASAPLVLVTGHRRENLGDGLDQICLAISTLARRFPDHLFAWPVHLNPDVHAQVHALLDGTPAARLLPPVGYRAFVALLRRCRLVLTDSGGVQEEAPSLGKPVLVMRDTTERPEGLAAGTALLTGADAPRIVAAATRLLTDEGAYQAMARARSPYGDGRATERIMLRLRRHFDGAAAPELAEAV